MRLLLISPKIAYATARLLEEAGKQGFKVTSLDIRELAARNFGVDPNGYDALFIRQAYLETVHKMSLEELRPIEDLARRFAEAGKVVIDSALAKTGLGNGKFEVYQALKAAGIPIPRTEILSKIDKNFITYPNVLKWNFGFGARHVFFADGPQRLAEVAQRYPADEILVQDCIDAAYEYKYIVVGYKALPVAVRYRISPKTHVPDLKDFEIVQAADMPELTGLMEQSARITARELCKIDVLEAAGQFYILEVNRWPGLKPFEEATGYNVAGAFMEYVTGQA